MPKQSWLLLGGAGAISCDHVDAAGKATFVHVEAGLGKIWLIALGRRDLTKPVPSHSEPWVDEPWAHTTAADISWVSDYYWQAIYLPQGSTL